VIGFFKWKTETIDLNKKEKSKLNVKAISGLTENSKKNINNKNKSIKN